MCLVVQNSDQFIYVLFLKYQCFIVWFLLNPSKYEFIGQTIHQLGQIHCSRAEPQNNKKIILDWLHCRRTLLRWEAMKIIVKWMHVGFGLDVDVHCSLCCFIIDCALVGPRTEIYDALQWQHLHPSWTCCQESSPTPYPPPAQFIRLVGGQEKNMGGKACRQLCVCLCVCAEWL